MPAKDKLSEKIQL